MLKNKFKLALLATLSPGFLLATPLEQVFPNHRSAKTSLAGDAFLTVKKETLKDLMERVDIYHANTQDVITFFHKMACSLQLHPNNLQAIHKSIQTALTADELLDTLLKGYQAGTNTVFEVIEQVLLLRFSLIHSAVENAKIFYESKNQGKILYGSPDPSLYESLTEEEKFLARRSTDRYQLLNKIILGLLSLTKASEAPPMVKRLLRASVSLCKLIETGRKDLGSLHETFDQTGQRMLDGEYLQTHLRTSESIEVTFYTSFSKETKLINVCPYEKKLVQPHWKYPFPIAELPYPEFLKHPTLRQNKQRPLPLPKEKKVEQQKLEQPLPEESLPLPENQVSKEGQPLEDKKEGLLSPEPTSQDEPVPSSMDGPTDTPKDAPQTRQESPKEKLSLSEVIIKKKPKGVAANTATQNKQVHLPPKGMRSVGKASASFRGADFSNLNGKSKKTLQDIFDPKTREIKYSELHSLWTHVNGDSSIRQTGGSHKELMDKDGKVVTGIYAHGNNQRYGPKSIKYIRDAFIKIGYQRF